MNATSTGLRIASAFELPLDAITEAIAILAKRGSGKTHTASVIVEEVVTAGHPAVVIDPLGVWWGLRSSASGKSAGLPVVIFGGEHADLPLDEKQGAVIAEAIVEGRFPAIIDLSLLSKGAARRFAADFLEALYQRNRQALMLVVDEADLFAPQRSMPDTARVLGAMEDVVRRGRSRGIGCVMITQRPAVLNKDVLSQSSVLIAMRMSGKIDVAAIDDWVRLHADEDEARAMKASLPSLPIGTGWVWSPGLDAKDGWPQVSLNKVGFRRRTTFDSSSTPKVGEARIVPRKLADIDLTALGGKLDQAREQAEAHSPAALRRKLAAAERQIAGLEARRVQTEKVVERVEVPVEVRIEIPVLTAADQQLLDQLASQLSQAGLALESIRARLPELNSRVGDPSPPSLPAAPAPPAGGEPPRTGMRKPPTRPEPDPQTTPSAGVVDLASAEVQLKAGARRIVEVMARHYPQWLTKSQIGVLASFKTSGGTFNTYWGAIRRAGLVTDRNSGKEFQATQTGLAFAGVDPGSPLTTGEVLAQWRGVLKRGARNMLDLLVDAWPNGLTRDELADQLGMAMTGGTFNTYLGTLTRNGLAVREDGIYRAADIIVDRD